MPRIKNRALDFIKTFRTDEQVLNLSRCVPAEYLWPATLEKEADKRPASFGHVLSMALSFHIDPWARVQHM